jgi:hypothetical protein
MENHIFNDNKLCIIRYSFIIYSSILNNFFLLLDNFKKIYKDSFTFEVIILHEEDDANQIFNINNFNSYSFKISYIKINTKNYNINKYYNYAISLSIGDIIIFQYAECIHIDNILNIINKCDLINYMYTVPIIKLNSNEEHNFILQNIINNYNLDLILKKYSEFYKINLKEIKVSSSQVNLPQRLSTQFEENKKKNILKSKINKQNLKSSLNNNLTCNNVNLSNNSKNILQDSNNIFNFFIIHRKNLDIINGFDEKDNNFNFNILYNKLQNICNIESINSTLFTYNTSNLNKEIIEDMILIKNNNLSSNNNIFYKKRDYKVGIAVTIFSDKYTPSNRIEASKIFIKSLVEKIRTIPIIFLIDYNITISHYDYLIEKTKDNKNITIYKNNKNYGISKSKNICIKLLEGINIDYICLLDDDILIKEDFTNYIKEVLDNINIPLLANIDKKYKKNNMNKIINNYKFNITMKLYYYGNFLCINRFHIEKYGYFIQFPYKYGLEHIEFTERYLSKSKYKNYCLDLDNYFDDNIIVNNISQLSVHTIIIDNKKIKENHKTMALALKNIKYIPFILNNDDMVKI